MPKQNSTVAIFNDHAGAEHAVKELQRAGFDVKKLSLEGKDYHSDGRVGGYYNTGDRMRYSGELGAFGGGLWGLLFGSAFFFVAGIGPIVVGGPMVSWIVGALEGAALVGGLSAVGAALYRVGIPKDSVLKYETSLKANKVVKAENEKVAAPDFADAVEGEAETIRLVNEAANTCFVGLLRKLEALEDSLSQNAKIVISSGSELVNVIGEMAGVLPLRKQIPATVPDQSL